MRRLNLAIADTDENYVESLADFLIARYSELFQVSSFTKIDYLIKYLEKSKVKADILLINPDMFSDSISLEAAGCVIFLTVGNPPAGCKGYDTVNKYQHGDMLVSDIINIFSEEDCDGICTKYGNRKTRVIAVCSPAGGAGKTCISVASSIVCAQLGLSAFYLNLEGIHSTKLFFNCESEQNFSKMIYYLKERDENLALRIEGIRCIDHQYNVHYFSPPDSILELDELLPDEMQLLIRQLKFTGRYDIVFVDMPGGFDRRNLALLEACDEVFLIITPDELSLAKTEVLLTELEMLSQKNDWQLYNRLTLIMNKYRNNGPFRFDDITIRSKSVSAVIPAEGELMLLKEPQWFMNADNGFAAGVRRLVSKYLEKEDRVIV